MPLTREQVSEFITTNAWPYRNGTNAQMAEKIAQAWLREWDRHKPRFLSDGEYRCPACGGPQVYAPDDLCPARKRLAGVSDAAD